MRGLYAIVDTDALARRGLSPVAFAEAVLDARPAAIQLRDKHGSAGDTLSLLRAIAVLAARAGVPLFANDRPDLAVLARCDGIHVGQGDLPVREVRRFAAKANAPLRIGLSTHTLLHIDRALGEPALLEASALVEPAEPADLRPELDLPPDYLAIGPVFATSSKEQPDAAVGLESLAALCAAIERARPGLPVVAIGGISLENAARVSALCPCAAVIAALLPERDGPGAYEEASARARALHAALGGAALGGPPASGSPP